jgi:hypothetical protein
MEQTSVSGPRHLTKAQLKQQRALKKAENHKKWDHAAVVQKKVANKTLGKELKAKNVVLISKRFPHDVVVSPVLFSTPEARRQLREWFWTQNIRAYHANTDEVLDVIWDNNWMRFSFAKPEHVMMFQLVYS